MLKFYNSCTLDVGALYSEPSDSAFSSSSNRWKLRARSTLVTSSAPTAVLGAPRAALRRAAAGTLRRRKQERNKKQTDRQAGRKKEENYEPRLQMFALFHFFFVFVFLTHAFQC
jgi:hypothetical protein